MSATTMTEIEPGRCWLGIVMVIALVTLVCDVIQPPAFESSISNMWSPTIRDLWRVLMRDIWGILAIDLWTIVVRDLWIILERDL